MAQIWTHCIGERKRLVSVAKKRNKNMTCLQMPRHDQIQSASHIMPYRAPPSSGQASETQLSPHPRGSGPVKAAKGVYQKQNNKN